MQGDRIIEISEFSLSYDGMFKVGFNYEGRDYFKPIYLAIEMLLKIIEREKLSHEDLQSINSFDEAPVFKKSTLLIEVFIEAESEEISFLTSEESEHLQDCGYYLIAVELKADRT
jgi:hypothetical protein